MQSSTNSMAPSFCNKLHTTHYSPLDTSALENIYSGQFTLSTQLMKTNLCHQTINNLNQDLWCESSPKNLLFSGAVTNITTVFGIPSEKVDNFTIFSNVSVDITIPSLLFEFSWSGVNQLGVERSSENFSLFTFTENLIESFKNILPAKMLDYQTFKLSLSLANQMEPAS